MPCAKEGLANACYFLMIISWEQLSLDLEVNVDSIPVLYRSYINKLCCYYLCKKFRGFHCPRKLFTDEIFPDYGTNPLIDHIHKLFDE